jgi:hypothetical protein
MQRDLFDNNDDDLNGDDDEARRYARNEHPETSHLSAQQLIDSGQLGRMKLVALDLVCDFNGYTGRELDVIFDKTYGTQASGSMHKRLRELLRLGLVKHGERRACSISGRRCLTWFVV